MNVSRTLKQVMLWCAIAIASGCTALGFSDEVLWQTTSPDGQLVAVCQEVPAFDGPDYQLRLERADGTVLRQLYTIGDGSPCSEVVWSPDGRILAVLSGHVARIRFVDAAWALSNPEVHTAHWSWRVVDLSTEHTRVEGEGLRFVGPRTVQLHLCKARPVQSATPCAGAIRRFDIPEPIVTGHR